MFESVQGISGHNNKPSSTVYKQLYVSTLATKKAREGALQIMVEESSFLKDHTFHQAVLLAVTYDRNKNQILLSFAIVVFYTEDNWLWLKHQLEQFFQGPMSSLQTPLRGLRVGRSKIVSGILDDFFKMIEATI